MRKTVIALVSCTVILLIGYAGYRGYKVWKRDHMMSLARQFAAKSDARNTLLCLQQVLRSNPRHLEGARMMAQLMDAARSPSALLWRSRVVEISPHSMDDRLALAETALKFRDYPSATNALEGIDAPGKKTAAYHNIAGAVALAAGQVTQAEEHFQEAARLEPSNLAPQMNLAVVRLHGTNDLDVAEARIMLQRLRTNPTNAALRCQALRELATDALRNRQTDAALALTKDLMAETNSVFTDDLLRLQVLHKSKNAKFNPALAAFQRQAGTNSAKIYELATWQMANTGPADALAWLQSLPKDIQINQPVALLEAQCLAMLGDWKGLQASLDKQNWAELEFLRLAYDTLALRSQNLDEGAKAQWALALNASNSQKSSLLMLFRFAAQWKWQSEGEDILWTVVNRYPAERWAFQALSQALFAGGRTRPLMQLYSQELKRTPSDLNLKNNVAMTALLLDASELKPHDLAREVHEKAPTNSAFASTYAFSLYLQGKSADALKVMQQLKPADIDKTSTAGYYGLILKATGDTAKARFYLDWAAKGQLLPEERKLFERAKAGV